MRGRHTGGPAQLLECAAWRMPTIGALCAPGACLLSQNTCLFSSSWLTPLLTGHKVPGLRLVASVLRVCPPALLRFLLPNSNDCEKEFCLSHGQLWLAPNPPSFYCLASHASAV